MKITDIEIFVVDGGRPTLALLRRSHRRGHYRIRRVRLRRCRTLAGRTGRRPQADDYWSGPRGGREALLRPLPSPARHAWWNRPDGHRRHRARLLGHQGQGARSPGQQPRRRTLPRQPARVLVPPRQCEGRRPFASARQAPEGLGRGRGGGTRGSGTRLRRLQDQHPLARRPPSIRSPRVAMD